MPDYYPSIGEAVGVAMQHNIRLAHGAALPAEPPLQVRYIPPPTADPHSLPGMVVRLEEDATPNEVAGIIEQTTDTLVGPLPQLTELVAASADWARARMDFSGPHDNPAFEVWTRLATAHRALVQVQEDLESVIAAIAACPADVIPARDRETVQVLRSRELLHDVMGAKPSQADGDAERRQAALSGSPSPPPGALRTDRPLPGRTAMSNLADEYGTDVEVLPWADGLVWADCRTGIPKTVDHVLRSCGFTAPINPDSPVSYSLARDIVGHDRLFAASSAAGLLTDMGFRVAIDPALTVGYVGDTVEPGARRLAATRQTSPAAAKAGTSSQPQPPSLPAPPSAATRPAPRAR